MFSNVKNKHRQLQTTTISSSKLTIKGAIKKNSFSSKAMVIVTCKALEINKCPWDWLNTQALTTEKKTINNDLRDIPS